MPVFVFSDPVFCIGVVQDVDDAESSGTLGEVDCNSSCLSFFIENLCSQKVKIWGKNFLRVVQIYEIIREDGLEI